MGMLALKILGPLALLGLVLGWGVRVNHLRGVWQARTVLMVDTTAKAAGIPHLTYAKAPGVIRQLAADRDAFHRQRDEARNSLQDQTDRVIALSNETATLKAQADRAAEQVRALTRQRDGWIRKAQIASTRTERKAAEAEAAECSAAMDALYQAGF